MNKKVLFLLSTFSLMSLSLLFADFNLNSNTVIKASVSDYDINGDGAINIADRTLELRYLNGSLTAYDVSVFDLNDNESFTKCIIEYISGMTDQFAIEVYDNGIINRVDYEILNDYINDHMFD